MTASVKADLPVPPGVAMLWRLLRHQPLLALVPLNLARPLLDERELVELRVGEPVHIEPIGVLQPKGGMGEAAVRFAEFLRKAR